VKVYILGIDHEIQLANSHRRPSTERVRFAQLLSEIFSDHQIEFIGEETFTDRASIARTFGGLRDIPWEAIEMSDEAREKLGIADEQAERNPSVWDINPTEPKRVLSDYIRDEYMLWRTLTKAGKAQSVLVICGFMHSDNLGKLFQREGHEVTIDSLCSREWYSHPGCPEA
jgi:hypothetical protein